MKLVYPEYQLEVSLRENQITILTIENQRAYAGVLSDLWNQTQGGEGGFVLSECEKILSISKEMECIFNPFALDCNDKKVIHKLYQELKEQAEENLLLETTEINREILLYLQKVLEQVPYALNYEVDLELPALLKIYDVKVDSIGTGMLERLVEYMKVLNQICHMRIFVFIGLKQYLTREELEKLYEFVFYEKIILCTVEAVQTSHINGEKNWLLDKDLCIIEL